MKIVFLVDVFPRLSETFILNQITGLIDRGHEVDIYANRKSEDTKIHEDVEKYNLLSRTFYFEKAFPTNKIVRLLKAFVLFTSHFHKNPHALLKALNVFKYKKDALNLSILYRTVHFIDNGDYDVVHCHFGPNGILGALLKDVGAFKGKVITVFHGHDITQYVQWNGRGVYDYLFEKGDLFLPISERWKNELISLGCRKDKINVHRMGIDSEKFKCSRQNKESSDKLIILSVSRLVEKKGIMYGIKAVGRIIGQHPNIEYRIIGNGPLMADLKADINRLELGEKIKLLGCKTQEQIFECMKDSDILLAPSVTSTDGDQEGIPVVLMEAMAMGLPVVSTYHSGIPELVNDGVSGFLVLERDVDALAERLVNLLKHPEQRKGMGNAGRKHVEEYYDINRLNDRLISVFEQLCVH